MTAAGRVRGLLAPLRDPAPRLLLTALLTVDAALIAAHLGQKFLGRPTGLHFDLGVDHAWGELLLFVKWVWIAVFGLIAWRRRRAPVFLALAAICVALLAEDGMMLHERVGWALQPWVTASISALHARPLVAIQIGELLWYGLLVIAISVVFVVGWRRSDPMARREAISVASFLALFAFFAVGVDSVHSLVDHGTTADSLLTALEDGGEIAAVSPAVACAMSSALRDVPPRA